MNDLESALPSVLPGKTLKLQKNDMKKLQLQHEELQLRVNNLKDLITEKDQTISSQRISIKLHEEKISSLSLSNDTLKHIIHILSKHITDVLKENLPSLPPIPQDQLGNIDGLLAYSTKRKKKSKRKINLVDLDGSASNSHSIDQVAKGVRSYYEFIGCDILKALCDAQDSRRASQQAARAQGKYTIVTSHRISLFESLSFFLSIRNVAFGNKFEVFLPRVLEMMTDILDLDRIILYAYEDQQFYSMAITGDIGKQIIIPKAFSHLFAALDQTLVIHQAYEDSRFDIKYDHITGFKTNNLACFPLKIGEETIGVLEFGNKKNEFIKEDIIFLALVSKQIALGVAGKLYQEKFYGINPEPNEKIFSSQEALIYPSIKSLVLNIKSLIGCEQVLLYRISDDKSELVCVVSSEDINDLKVSLSYSFSGLCYTSKKGIIISNAQEHSMYNPEIDLELDTTTKEILLMPLGNIGTLECINKPKGFSARDQNKVLGFSVVAKDILEAADKLKNMILGSDVNEMFCEHIKENLICVDYNGIVIKVNTPALQFLETSKEKVLGYSITQVLENADQLLRLIVRTRGKNNKLVEKILVKGRSCIAELIQSQNNFLVIITLN
jgi:GAF domain